MPSETTDVPRTLTVAGTEVARIGLGTNRLKPIRENLEFIEEAVDGGLQLIDTAHVYTDGESEQALGEALTPRRDDVVIATKGGYGGAATPEALRAQLEQSFQSLRTDVIDLYYLHRIDPDTPLEDSLSVIAEHHEAGRIKEVGLSAVGVEEIEAAQKVVPISAVQNHFNLSERGSDEVLDYCEEKGLVFFPYYPLKGDEPAAVAEIARAHDATHSQIALAWLLRLSPVTLPIPGTRSIDHLRENLGALDIELTDAEFEALT